jgi:hypothetical protein
VLAAIVNDRPILSSDRMLNKDYNSNCSSVKVKVKISLFQAVEAHRVARG